MENIKKIFTLKVIDILEFLMMLVVFIDVNSVYTEAIINNKLPTQSGVHNYARLICFALAVILIGMHIVYDRENIGCIKKYKSFAIFQGIFLFLFYVLNVMQVPDGTGYIESFFLFMTAMPLLFKMYRREGRSFELLYKLEYIVLFVAIVSFFLWLGSSVFNLLGESQDVRVLWGGNYYDTNYLNLCFRRYWPDDITKNLGIFTEPPMFGLFLNVALYTELFLKKRSNIYIVFAIFCGLFSCKAIIAIMISVIAVVLKVIDLFKEMKYIKYIVFLLILLGGICLIGLFIYKMRIANYSGNIHIDDYLAPLKCFIHNNWIIGCGFDDLRPIIEYESEFRADIQGMSNSIAPVLAQGGLMLSAYYLAPFVIIIYSFFKKNSKLACWGIGMLALYCTVIFYLRVLVFVFLAFGFSMIEVVISKKKPYVKLTVDYPKDNNESVINKQASKWYHKFKIIDGYMMPDQMMCMITLLPIVISVYSMITWEKCNKSTIICSIITLLTNIVLVILKVNITKKHNLRMNKVFNYILYGSQFIIYSMFICVGHMYTMIDKLLRVNKLLVQDSQWRFVLFIIAVYCLVSTVDCIVKCRSVIHK